MEKRGKRGIAKGPGTRERGTTHVSSFKFVIVMWYKPDTIVDLPSCSKHFIVAILKFNRFIMRDPELWLALSLSLLFLKLFQTPAHDRNRISSYTYLIWNIVIPLYTVQVHACMHTDNIQCLQTIG